jgi:uncharacterized protein YbdZ (MbtH family)
MRLSIFLLACLIAWVTHEWGDEKPLPDGWRWTSMRADTANCSAFADKRPTFTAERPVSIRCTSESPGYAAARFNFPVDALRGKRAGLFADVRVENVSKGSRLWLRVDRPGQFGAASDDMEDRPLRGTSDWFTVAVHVDVPSDASTLLGGIALEGSGKISVSNIRIEAISNNFQMDANPPVPPPPPAPADLNKSKDKK